jgi:flagellar protein FliL
MQHFWILILLAAILSVPGLSLAQDDKKEGETSQAAPVTQYVNIKPAFIANYGGAGRLRYLKTDVTLRVGKPSVSAVRRHMPYIRHALVQVLSKSSEEEVASMEGRELIRQNALKAVQNLLAEEEGEQFVVDLLFNSFIVQR